MYNISNETSEMLSKYKKFSSKLFSCIHLHTLFQQNLMKTYNFY